MDELLAEAGVKAEDFVPRAWSLGVIGGKRYGIPLDTHVLGLYYNTELFEKAGLDPKKPPVTMDEFVGAAKKLTTGPNHWGVAIPSSTAWPVRYWMAFLAQQGGKMFTDDLKKASFNDPKGKAAFQFMSDLIHVHKVAPPVMTDINKGAVSAVSLLMRLAAAVETRLGAPRNRPCLVVAGGREPPYWTAYPHHHYIHTLGALRCCDDGGCWRSRTRPLGDGDEKDRPDQLCLDVVGDLPRCMDMIGADEVIRRIEAYFEGGALEYRLSGKGTAARRSRAHPARPEEGREHGKGEETGHGPQPAVTA